MLFGGMVSRSLRAENGGFTREARRLAGSRTAG
jgi:hypothetical protein